MSCRRSRSLDGTALTLSHSFLSTLKMATVANLQRFQRVCPFLRRTSATDVARSLSGIANINDGVNRLSSLSAQRCPVIGEALSVAQRGYASAADRSTIDEIHRREGVPKGAQGVCPMAAAGHRAAQQASQLAQEKAAPVVPQESARAHQAQQALNAAAARVAPNSTGKFNYEAFYTEELDKKHRDKSYRCVSGLW